MLEKVKENGHKINVRDLPNTKEVVQDMLKRAHGFFLQVGNNHNTTQFWTEVFGSDRVVVLPSTELLPQVQATIIGLTEGTLDLKMVPDFLATANVEKKAASAIVRSVANIPIGAQAALPNFLKRPKKGDLFKEKTDIWPIDPTELGKGEESPKPKGKKKKSGDPNWL